MVFSVRIASLRPSRRFGVFVALRSLALLIKLPLHYRAFDFFSSIRPVPVKGKDNPSLFPSAEGQAKK